MHDLPAGCKASVIQTAGVRRLHSLVRQPRRFTTFITAPGLYRRHVKSGRLLCGNRQPLRANARASAWRMRLAPMPTSTISRSSVDTFLEQSRSAILFCQRSSALSCLGAGGREAASLARKRAPPTTVTAGGRTHSGEGLPSNERGQSAGNGRPYPFNKRYEQAPRRRPRGVARTTRADRRDGRRAPIMRDMAERERFRLPVSTQPTSLGVGSATSAKASRVQPSAMRQRLTS